MKEIIGNLKSLKCFFHLAIYRKSLSIHVLEKSKISSHKLRKAPHP